MGIFGKKSEAKDAVIDDVDAKGAKSDKAVTPPKAKAASLAPVKAKYAPEARAEGVIIAPIVTEKTHTLSKNGKYVFRVAKTANKTSVKSLIADLYKVTVVDVNIINTPKKRRTVKYDRGYQKSYKKAIVTLKEGDHIAAFDLA